MELFRFGNQVNIESSSSSYPINVSKFGENVIVGYNNNNYAYLIVCNVENLVITYSSRYQIDEQYYIFRGKENLIFSLYKKKYVLLGSTSGYDYLYELNLKSNNTLEISKRQQLSAQNLGIAQSYSNLVVQNKYLAFFIDALINAIYIELDVKKYEKEISGIAKNSGNAGDTIQVYVPE